MGPMQCIDQLSARIGNQRIHLNALQMGFYRSKTRIRSGNFPCMLLKVNRRDNLA